MLKKLLRNTPFFPILKKIYRLIKMVPRHPLQDRKEVDGYNILHLGTKYGGYSFVDEDYLNGCTIISAGLGEDASFDIEFARKYNAKVIIVDPTPRSIKYFEELMSSIGTLSSTPDLDDGQQPISAYDLSSLSEANFQLVEKALWDKKGRLRFFEPTNPSHVSHSIINFQNNYSNETKFIEVDAIPLDLLLTELNINSSDLLLMKLDIEGAEIEVLTHCLSKGILPRQILVEFDELLVPSDRGFKRATKMDELLIKNGYKMLKTDGVADFLYYRD